MCIEIQTRYICCETSDITPCDREHSESEPFCDIADIEVQIVENLESLCLDCHTWVRDIGGEEVLDGLYEDFRKLLNKRKGDLDLDYAFRPDQPQSKETTRFWKKFCKALVQLEEEEDFSNRMRGIVRGQTPVLDELASKLRRVNLAAVAASKLPRVKDEDFE